MKTYKYEIQLRTGKSETVEANLVDAYITSIKSTPHEDDYGGWWVEVGYNCYGRESVTDLRFDSEDEAKQITVGEQIDIYI